MQDVFCLFYHIYEPRVCKKPNMRLLRQANCDLTGALFMMKDEVFLLVQNFPDHQT